MTLTFVTRRLLTDDEKYRRAIFFYTYDMDDFELFYVNDVYEEDKYILIVTLYDAEKVNNYINKIMG